MYKQSGTYHHTFIYLRLFFAWVVFLNINDRVYLIDINDEFPPAGIFFVPSKVQNILLLFE